MYMTMLKDLDAIVFNLKQMIDSTDSLAKSR